MRSAAVIQGPWLRLLPGESRRRSRGRRPPSVARPRLGVLVAARFALRRGRAFVADVLAQELEWRGVSDAACRSA
mgnify:CR=1 FL=1